MSITRGATSGPVLWATVDTDPSNHPTGEDPDVRRLPIAIYEALSELSDGNVCATATCENLVGGEITEDDAGRPVGRWHDVTLVLPAHTGVVSALCEDCAYPTLTALTGKAPW